MRRVIRTVVIVAVFAGSLSPVAFGGVAAAQSDEDTPAEATEGGELPDEALEAPADLSDDTDTDGDGLSDAEETSGARNPWPSGFVGMAAPGDPTDPNDTDSDDDGLSDGTEIGTADGNRAGTASDPNDADTDDDGVEDAAEVVAGSDPRAADTDDDDVDDGAEREAATNPNAADTDFDGQSDGAEVEAGSDPTVSSISGLEAGGAFHFTDVPAGVYYEDGAYWATGRRVGVLPRAPRFKPNAQIKRWKLAQILRNYADYLGRDITAPPHSFRDIGALRPAARAGVSWATSNGIIPPTTPGTFTPGRTVRRAQLATALFRFSVWAGHDAAPAPADNPYTDTTTQSATTRGAIGWLALQGIIPAGAVPSATRFKPTTKVTRAHAVSFLFALDQVIGTRNPTGDTDGDGISNLDELQGFRNPYPEPTDGGDVDPLDPNGRCLSPDVPGDLPPAADGPGAPTDPADPDSDDDGISDGVEMREKRTDPNDADTDNDCLSDGREVNGWPLVLDLDGQGCPGGGGGGCPNLTRYLGVSSPLDVDSDDDELPDHEELLLRTDAKKRDTDLDGLNDYVEWNQWFTSPTTVDSDQDSRGSDGTQPPTPSLFDGLELRDTGTSPSVADTDGDGSTDFDEFDSPTRNQLLAELPGFEMDFAGGTSIRLRKERSAEEGGAIAVGLSNSVETSTTSASSSSITQMESNAISVEAGIEFGYTSSSAHVVGHVNIGYSHEWGTERSREFSSEESRTLSEEQSKTEEESWTSSEATVSGEISQGMVFRNNGKFTYQLADVGYTLYLRDPETQEYEVVGTMTVPLDGIVLAPGARTAPIQAVAEDVNPDLIEQFLRSPSSLQFTTGNIEFLDSEGRNFEFVQESVFGQTAQVAVDFGPADTGEAPRLETYSVSTNVTRDEVGGPFNAISVFPGIQMGGMDPDGWAYEQGVMDQIGYPRCEGGPEQGCYTIDGNGDLESIDGLANVPDGQVACQATWTVTTQTQEQADTPDFDDLMVHAGDVIRLVRQTDCDEDDLPDAVESTYGAAAVVPDTDGDGLDDLAEAEGWIVGAPNGPGGSACPDNGVDPTPWVNDTAACPWVQPSPNLVDTDADGVTDAGERNGAGRSFNATPLDVRTDPGEGDTDGDRLSDCLAPGDECGGLTPDTAPLHAAVRRVDATPCTAPGCWTGTTPNLEAALDLSGVNQNADPRDDVRSIWVAEGEYIAPTYGFGLPTSAGVFGGFRGDELRLDDRSPTPTTSYPTVLVGNAGADRGVVEIHEDNATLDGVTVRGGTVSGVRGTASHTTLSDVVVTNNSHPAAGGLVPVAAGGITWFVGEDLLVSDSTVTSNSGPAGGVYVGQVAGVRIEDSTIRNNYSDGVLQSTFCTTTPANGCSGGGGVLLNDGSLTLEDTRVEDNTALVGAGIDVSGPDAVLRVRNSRVTGNTAQGNANVAGRGGGVHAHRSGRALIVSSLIADNQTRVGPRWFNATEDGFGGGVFAHQGADVRMINATVTGNNGGGMVVVGAEVGNSGLVLPATAVAQNSIFLGNSMGWQATYTDVLPGLLGTQGRASSLNAIQTVANGVLGYNEEWNNGGVVANYNECLGGGGAGAPFEDDNCQFVWFTGLSSTSSTEIRTGGSPGAIATNGPNMTTQDSMVGADDTPGEFGRFCNGLQYFGRTEEPTTANNRGTVTCGTDSATGRYLGLRGRGFQGNAIRPLTAPVNVDELFAFPDYELLPGTRAIDRGNQNIDWDPFTAGIQDAPTTDVNGEPRLVGRRIDLGAFELQ